MAVVWLLLGLTPAVWRVPCREQLPIATCTCSVLGTMLLCANQNYDLLQSIAFGLAAGWGTCLRCLLWMRAAAGWAVRTCLRSSAGCPVADLYWILSLALYALME